MRIRRAYFISGLLGFLFPFLLTAQINVSKIDGSFNPVNQEGIIYALPRTVIQVDVTIEQKELMAGPLRNYAEEYLGITNIISQNGVEYSLKDIHLNTFSEPDPDQYYFVGMMEKSSREEWQMVLNINGKGMITSLNTSGKEKAAASGAIAKVLSNDELMELFRNYADLNLYARVDTIVRTINIDTVTIEDYSFRTTMIEKPLEVKAREVAEMIDKIREERYKLITGYQEVNYSEGAFRFLKEESVRMENEYLRLFTGVAVKTELTYTFTFLPTAANAGQSVPLFRLSKNAGVGTGDAVSIMVTPSGNTAAVVPAETGTGKGIYYRLPEDAQVKVQYRGNTAAQIFTSISQLGKLGVLPPHATNVEFDGETGGLRSIQLNAE
jgi:hypothetical protein